jgi:hypothetical protein
MLWEKLLHTCRTQRYALKMNLIEMESSGDLSSTGYVLANPGQEYLVLQPSETADPFTVTLEAGTYSVQWCSVNTRETNGDGKVTVPSGNLLAQCLLNRDYRGGTPRRSAQNR